MNKDDELEYIHREATVINRYIVFANYISVVYTFRDIATVYNEELRRWLKNFIYRKTSNISRTLAANKIVDNSDVVGASPVGAAPTTSSFSIEHMVSMDWAKTTERGYKKHLSFRIWCDLY